MTKHSKLFGRMVSLGMQSRNMLSPEQLSYEDAITLCEQLRDGAAGGHGDDWWWVKKQDAKLWRGMEEFV